MRLWDISLIENHCLPKMQLKGQWSELNSIYANKNKHILINFVYNYRDVDLYIYSKLFIKEYLNEGLNIRLYDKFNKYFEDFLDKEIDLTQQIFCGKMNDIYLRQCLYNLEEKYMCGQFKYHEWKKIYDIYGNKFELIKK